MLNKNQLKEIFEKGYSRNNWINIIKSINNEPTLYGNPRKLDIKNNLVKTANMLGSFNTTDGMIIGLYEIEITDNVIIERNRVGLRNLLRSQYKQVDGCFAVYYQGNKWRFSYISETRVFENNKWIESKTEPKRFTYVLGDNETVRTAVKRFEVLFLSDKKLQDIRDAFSIERVTKEFFDQIAQLFAHLTGGERKVGSKLVHFKSLLKLPGSNDKKNLQEFAVRLIGRIVFCWFLNKKVSINGIPLIPSEVLSLDSVKKNNNYYHSILEVLFFEALNTRIEERKKNISDIYKDVPFLNGGLFEPNDDDYYKPSLINSLIIPDSWFVELFTVLENFNFTIDENTSIDIELSVDPEMLGRIFENLLAEINPETGESARKSTGSYYTPREIVEYMVDESLKLYLNNKTGIEDIKLDKLVSYSSEENGITKLEKVKILQSIDNVKILDPACGSGAFPIGALQKMLLILQKIDPNSELWFEKMVSGIEDITLKNQIKQKFESENLNFVRKFGLIQKCIYGVDIQTIAVELSKLRCFLTLVVDEEIDDKKPNRGIIPLPNLEFKFVAANALIGLEEESNKISLFDESEEITKLEELRNEYFIASGTRKEEIIKHFIKVQKNISSIISQRREHSGRSLQLANWEPFTHSSSSWFSPKWMFGIGDGFGIIIGNPPYINIKNQDDVIKKFIRSNYSFSIGADIYVAFMERSINLLTKYGLLYFIVPNKFFGADYGSNFRKFIQNKNVQVSTIWDLKDEKVFKNALISTIVIGIKKIIDDKPIKLIQKDVIIQVKELFDSTGKIQIESDTIDRKILNKIDENKLLSEFADVRTGIMGFEYWKMEPIIKSNGKLNENRVRIYTNGNFKRYEDNWIDETIKLYKNEYCAPTIDLNVEYLNKNTITLFKTRPKIIVRGVSKRVASIIDENGSGLLVAVHSIIPNNIKDIKWLTVLLNSNLVNWYHLKTIYSIRIPQGSLKYPVSFFNNIPIIEPQNKKLFENQYNNIIKHNSSSKRIDIDRELDCMVYKLYHLEYDEIKIIQSDIENTISKKDYDKLKVD